MLIDTPTLEKEISTRSSQMLDGYGLDDSSSHPSSIEKRSQEQKVSQILRSENSNGVKSRGLNMRTQNVPQLPVDYERSSANSMTSSFSQSGQGLRKVGTEGEYSEKSEHYHGQVITDSSPGQNRGTFHDAATRFTGQPPLITRSVSGDIDKVPVLAPAVPITHTDDTSTALGRGVVAVHGSPNVTTVTSGPMQTTTTTTTTTRVLPDGRTSTTTTTAYPINRNGSHSLTQPAAAYAVGNTVRPGPTTTGQNGTQYAGAPPRPSFMTLDHSSSRGPTGSNQQNSSSPGHTVSRPDLRASAEQILYTFILPGSEREIVLPQAMVDRMIYAIEEEGRDDPEVFDSAKEYVFQAMERDAFPGFLQAKALGNLVPLDILIRLIIGLLTLGAGFWAGYYFILRNKSRRVRCWVRHSSISTHNSALLQVLTMSTGHPTFHHRHVLPGVVPIQARHVHRLRWSVRIYLDELVQSP